jgi:hypothetical protein
LEEVSSLITERRSRKDLDSPSDNGDLGTSPVGAFETIEERNSGLIFDLMLIGADHHCNCFGRIGGIALSRQSAHGVFGLLQFSGSD